MSKERWDDEGRRLIERDRVTGRGGELWQTLPARLNAIFDWFQDIGVALVGRVKNSIEVDPADGKAQLKNDLPDSALVPNLNYGTDEDGNPGWKPDLGGTIAGQPVDAPTPADDGRPPVWDAAQERYVHQEVAGGAGGRALKVYGCQVDKGLTSEELEGDLHVQLQVSKAADFGAMEHDLDSETSQANWMVFSGMTWETMLPAGFSHVGVDKVAFVGLNVTDQDVRYIRWRLKHGSAVGEWVGDIR